MAIRLKHSNSGLIKKIPEGFSWTSLFFGWFVPVVRGDVKWAILWLIITIFTAGIGQIVMAFTYNKSYLKRMLENGYIPADDEATVKLTEKGLIEPNREN